MGRVWAAHTLNSTSGRDRTPEVPHCILTAAIRMDHQPFLRTSQTADKPRNRRNFLKHFLRSDNFCLLCQQELQTSVTYIKAVAQKRQTFRFAGRHLADCRRFNQRLKRGTYCLWQARPARANPLDSSAKAANHQVFRSAFSRLPTAQSKIEARHRCCRNPLCGSSVRFVYAPSSAILFPCLAAFFSVWQSVDFVNILSRSFEHRFATAYFHESCIRLLHSTSSALCHQIRRNDLPFPVVLVLLSLFVPSFCVLWFIPHFLIVRSLGARKHRQTVYFLR